MRFFTFSPNHNPGRSSAWTARGEAIRQADRGASSLAGIILRDGYSILPAAAVLYTKNEEKITLAELCAEIVAGLSERKSEGGGVKPILNGTPIDLFKRRLADLADKKAAGIVLDGRSRTVGSIIAYGCGRDDIDMQGTEATPEQEIKAQGIGPNYLHNLANKLDPWAKVEAALAMLGESPSMSEAEMMKATEVLRGDAQLMHRAATAIRMHGITFDVNSRCLGKEEWAILLPDPKGKRPTPTADEAKALYESMVTGVREKAIGVDVVQSKLEVLPETLVIRPRELAAALKSGKRSDFDAWLKAVTA